MKPTSRPALSFTSIVALIILVGAASLAPAAPIRFDGGGSALESDVGETNTITFRASPLDVLGAPIVFEYWTTDVNSTAGVDYQEIPLTQGILAPGQPTGTDRWGLVQECGGSDRPTAIDLGQGSDVFVGQTKSVNRYDEDGTFRSIFGSIACGTTWFFADPEYLVFDYYSQAHVPDDYSVHVYDAYDGGLAIDTYTPGTSYSPDAHSIDAHAALGAAVYHLLDNNGMERWYTTGDASTWHKDPNFSFGVTWLPHIDEDLLESTSICVDEDGIVHKLSRYLDRTGPGPSEWRSIIVRNIPTEPYDYPEVVHLDTFVRDGRLAIYEGVYYVLDRPTFPRPDDGSPVVRRFTSAGQAIDTFGRLYLEPGPTPGEFKYPYDIAIRWDGTVFVTDQLGEEDGRVHRFNPTDAPEVTIDVQIIGDADPEVNEAFTLTMRDVDTGSYTTLLGTILDDDPGVFVSGSTIAEGNAGTSTMNFQVGVTTPITDPVTVNYATSDGSAAEFDGDYTGTSGTLTFQPNGSTAPAPQVVRVDISGDTTQEGDESLTLELSNVTGAVAPQTGGVGTIMDDETTISLGEVSLPEGDAGQTPLIVPVTGTTPFYAPASFDFATADGTARAITGDYQAMTGSLNLPTLDARYRSEINMYNGSNNWRPHSISVDRDGMIVLTEVQGGVKTYTRDGQEGITFGTNAALPSYVNTGQMVAVDSQKNIYVADLSNGIIKFDNDGNFLGSFGGFPAYARAIAIDAADILYVVDSSGFKVDKYTAGGTLLDSWGSLGSGPDQFTRPVGIAIDANQAIYVSDETLDRIQKFSTDGTLLAVWGSSGTGPGEFRNPFGMAVDSKGRLHVCDEGDNIAGQPGNGVIKVFSPEGDYITEWSPVALGGTLDRPYDLDFDAEGVAWVVARRSNNLGAYVVESYDLDVILPPITVTVNGDYIFEDDETFSVEVTGTTGGLTVIGGGGVITIMNDDAPLGVVTYVDRANQAPGDGSSWATAFNDLALALDTVAQSPGASEIWVADGLYFPTSGTERDATFALSDGVQVFGGFAGAESARSERDPVANLSILSGDIGIPEDTSDNSYRVVSCVTNDSVPLVATLDGFVVTGANSVGQPETLRGGGIAVHYGTLTARNLQLVDNQAQFGGGVANQFGSLLLENSEIRGNTSVYGGGMDLRYSSSAITNVVVEDNTATYTGGIRLVVATLDMAHATVTNNSASVVYGGMELFVNSVVTCRNSIVWGNTAPSDPNVYLLQSTLDLGHSILEGSGGSGSWNAAFGTDGGGNLDFDPMFVNALIGDLRLQAGSPAIDSGDDSIPGLPSTDLDNNPRSSGLTVDMGAYEFTVIPTGVEGDVPNGLPARTAMHAPYPNPFNPRATVSFSLSAAGHTSIDIFDVRGRRVRTLLNQFMAAGNHEVVWSGRDNQGAGVSSGVYLVRFQSAGVQEVRRVTLVK